MIENDYIIKFKNNKLFLKEQKFNDVIISLIDNKKNNSFYELYGIDNSLILEVKNTNIWNQIKNYIKTEE